MNLTRYKTTSFEGRVFSAACLVYTLAFLLLAAPFEPADSRSLIYKDYIIRYDRGWDILCEPYVVQKNDWILKIFRQKGEIAHADFRDFLGIFQRLNPHIKNIDMIRPGQPIDIPLRKLEHGALPGQTSGVVTIPFVTLGKEPDVVQKRSTSYKVRWGDTVSKLIARHYGRYGTKSYNEGVQLFKTANPHIQDLNRIYTGQQVYLPDPTLRDQSGHADQGAAQGEAQDPAQIARTTGRTVSAGALQPLPEPAPPKSVLAQAAETVGGLLREKGTYYIPMQDTKDFEVDLSRHPMLAMPDHSKFFFTRDGRVMDQNPAAVRDHLPGADIISFDDQSSVEDIVGAIFNTMEQNQTETPEKNEIAFTDQGIRITIRARWIKEQTDQRKLCITPVSGPDELTPESMRRYLEQNGVVLKELLPGAGETGLGQTASQAQRHAVNNILALTPKSQKDFVQALARHLGFTFAPNVSISFPYAGIQVQAHANLLSIGNGNEVLVDFGDLYGDAITAIRKSGPRLIQINTDDDYDLAARKIFTALELDYMENPTFFAAKRPARYNTSVTIPGLLYEEKQGRKILLSSVTLPAAITDLLSFEVVDVLIW